MGQQEFIDTQSFSSRFKTLSAAKTPLSLQLSIEVALTAQSCPPNPSLQIQTPLEQYPFLLHQLGQNFLP